MEVFKKIIKIMIIVLVGVGIGFGGSWLYARFLLMKTSALMEVCF